MASNATLAGSDSKRQSALQARIAKFEQMQDSSAPANSSRSSTTISPRRQRTTIQESKGSLSTSQSMKSLAELETEMSREADQANSTETIIAPKASTSRLEERTANTLTPFGDADSSNSSQTHLPVPTLSQKTSSSSLASQLESIVYGIVVVDFDHALGPKVEYSYPEYLKDDESLSTNLPFLALPDGAHTVRFCLALSCPIDLRLGLSAMRTIPIFTFCVPVFQNRRYLASPVTGKCLVISFYTGRKASLAAQYRKLLSYWLPR